MTISKPYTVQGKGTTIAAATNGQAFIARVTNLDWDGVEVADIDTSNFSTTSGFMTFQGSTLANPGELTMELIADVEQPLPVLYATQQFTVTFPIPAGGTAGATIVCQGYFKSCKPISAPIDDKITATAVVKFSGVPVITAAS